MGKGRESLLSSLEILLSSRESLLYPRDETLHQWQKEIEPNVRRGRHRNFLLIFRRLFSRVHATL